MAARLSAFVIWALVAAGVVFWGYRFWGGASPLPAHAQIVREDGSPRADLTRLLGAAPVVADAAATAPAAESSRFRLVGVLAPKAGAGDAEGSGVALIAVDGRPPRAYVVGSRVDGDLMLSAVSHRSASLATAPGAPGVVLELPPLPPPATGTLPRVAADGGRVAPQAMLPPLGMAPGAAARSPVQQLQPGQAPGNANSDDDDQEEAPAPPPAAARPRIGGPTTR
jgi:general secretion pathway protein C